MSTRSSIRSIASCLSGTRAQWAHAGALACSLSLAVLLAACSTPPAQHFIGNAYRTHSFGEHSAGQEEIPIEAMGLVGTPYRYGGNTPAGGFDCSGLVQYVVRRAAGVDLPRTAAEMSEVGKPVDIDNLAAGDLVFFNTTGQTHSHVGIYVGDGQFVHAPSTGGTVKLANLGSPYWAKRLDGIRRVAAGRAPAETGGVTITQSPTPPSLSSPPAMGDAATASASPVATMPQGEQSPPTAIGKTDDDPIARFANF